MILNKYEAWDRLLKYEEEYLRKKLRDKADSIFNSWIRDRDKWLWCVSYGAGNCKNCVEHACHRIEAARYSHRRDENNVHWGCSTCNWYNKREHIMYYDQRMISKYWKKWTEKQLFIKHKIKPSIEELLAIINKYTKRQKKPLKNQRKSV